MQHNTPMITNSNQSPLYNINILYILHSLAYQSLSWYNGNGSGCVGTFIEVAYALFWWPCLSMRCGTRSNWFTLAAYIRTRRTTRWCYHLRWLGRWWRHWPHTHQSISWSTSTYIIHGNSGRDERAASPHPHPWSRCIMHSRLLHCLLPPIHFISRDSTKSHMPVHAPTAWWWQKSAQRGVLWSENKNNDQINRCNTIMLRWLCLSRCISSGASRSR